MKIKVFVCIAILLYTIVALGGVQAAPTVFQSPVFGDLTPTPIMPIFLSVVPIPESAEYTIYLAIITKNGRFPTQYTTACAENPVRGKLYRDLCIATITIMNPVADWTAGGCECGTLRAESQGRAFGAIMGMAFSIIMHILSLFGTIVTQTVALVSQLITLIMTPAEGFMISCTGSSEGFCVALAAIVSLDDMAGGLIMSLTILAVSLMSIYLILYIVGEVRGMMDPGIGSD